MSDDEADPELLEFLRESLGFSRRPAQDEISSDTGVLRDAEYIYNNSIDVSIDMYGTKGAATSIFSTMQQRGYSAQAWSEHELHPNIDEGFTDVDLVNFVFTMDLLNFSFWSALSDNERYQVDYNGRQWTGYNSLVACLRRALDEEVPITTPRFWNDASCSDETLEHVFRSATYEVIPLLKMRTEILREAGRILHESFGDPEPKPELEREQAQLDHASQSPRLNQDTVITEKRTEVEGNEHREEESAQTFASALEPHPVGSPKEADTLHKEGQKPSEIESTMRAAEAEPDKEPMPPSTNRVDHLPEMKEPIRPDLAVVRLIQEADHSAGKLVNLLAKYFPSFRDEARFDGKRVRFLKRAQIFVADLWAAFNGTGYGAFDDIDQLTMFADYRVPQILRSLGVLVFSPPLEHAISSLREIPSGHSWELQLRGCSIWTVELIRREILKQHPEATGMNAVLIDFFLYDLAKEREAAGTTGAGRAVAHHRTRSIWY